MTQTLVMPTGDTGTAGSKRTSRPPHNKEPVEDESPTNGFLSELRRMNPQERIEASRHTMNGHERSVYAARYPEEVPTVNGELEWIALRLA